MIKIIKTGSSISLPNYKGVFFFFFFLRAHANNSLPGAVPSCQFGDGQKVSPGRALLRVGAPPRALEAQGFVSLAPGTKLSTELGL